MFFFSFGIGGGPGFGLGPAGLTMLPFMPLLPLAPMMLSPLFMLILSLLENTALAVTTYSTSSLWSALSSVIFYFLVFITSVALGYSFVCYARNNIPQARQFLDVITHSLERSTSHIWWPSAQEQARQTPFTSARASRQNSHPASESRENTVPSLWNIWADAGEVIEKFLSRVSQFLLNMSGHIGRTYESSSGRANSNSRNTERRSRPFSDTEREDKMVKKLQQLPIEVFESEQSLRKRPVKYLIEKMNENKISRKGVNEKVVQFIIHFNEFNVYNNTLYQINITC